MADSIKVNIKMYRVNELGDCFLLSFSDNSASRCSNILIDCGSFRNGEKSKARMLKIAKDIQKQLKGEKLSVVVGTHQHNDHLSGFVHAEHIFREIKAEQVWLSWLDNPKDIHAKNIGQRQHKLAFQLHKISKGLEEAKNGIFKKTQVKQRIVDILGFYSPELYNEAPYVPLKGVENLKSISNEVKYLEPGQELSLPGLEGNSVRVYVLGPPRNKALLFDKDPKRDETYDQRLTMTCTLAENFLSALTNFGAKGADYEEEQQFPFNSTYEKKLDSDPIPNSSYNDEKKDWRKIDNDWLNQAERLAIFLDSYTNNSSLVLAFELVRSGKVLLFVGDAQTGNWLSWKDISWEKSGKSKTFDLLANTVLYKVGHHCSHNATLVELLEKMEHDELVAMIPVDRSDSHIRKVNGWKMPSTNLYKRLKEKTSNRVLVMDNGWDPDCDPDTTAKESWGKLPYKPKINDLYVEYTIQG